MSSKHSKVYVFDLWHTLIFGLSIDPIATTWELLSGGKTACPQDFMLQCLTTNESDPTAFAQALAGRFDLRIDADAIRAFEQLLEVERKAIGLYPDTLAVLDELKARGHRIAMASNLWPFAVPRIDEVLNLDDRFDHLTYSFEVGHRKPSCEIFNHVTEGLSVPASRCIMVGDSISSDIEGALAAGMEAVFIDRSSQLGQSSAEVPAGATIAGTLSELL